MPISRIQKSLDDAVVGCASMPAYLRKRPWEHEETWVLERVLKARRTDIAKIEYILECRKGSSRRGSAS